MRAARLLQILLILQNRGRQTAGQLAEELEVVPRTILRDVDAMTEAGLPIIVHQGPRGGIELGFNYRTRLTGLAQDEADALGLILASDNPMIDLLGLTHAAKRARAKLVESFPDKTRAHVSTAMARFKTNVEIPIDDPRIRALSIAIRARTIVKLRFATTQERVIHPIAIELSGTDCSVKDALRMEWVSMADWGRINVSAMRFPEV